MSHPGQPPKAGRRGPPKETQFKKGHSGNPRGRPKGSQNRASILRKVFAELVQVNVAGRGRKMPSGEAAVRVLMQKALQGNSAAIRDVMGYWLQAEEDAEKNREPAYPFTERDREVIDVIYSRLGPEREPTP